MFLGVQAGKHLPCSSHFLCIHLEGTDLASVRGLLHT